MAYQTDVMAPGEHAATEGAVRQDVEKRVAVLEKLVGEIINMLVAINERIELAEPNNTGGLTGQQKKP